MKIVCDLPRDAQGDLTVLPLLRDALEADPSVWQEYGDLAAQAQEAWLQLLAGTDYLLAESVRLKLAPGHGGDRLGKPPAGAPGQLVDRGPRDDQPERHEGQHNRRPERQRALRDQSEGLTHHRSTASWPRTRSPARHRNPIATEGQAGENHLVVSAR